MRAFDWIGVTTGALLVGMVGVSRADDTVKAAEQNAAQAEQKARDAQHEARELQRQADAAEKKAEKAEQDAMRARHEEATVKGHHQGRAAPVKHVDKTDESVGTEVSDSWITTKVKTSYATDSGLKGSDISVDTNDHGVVSLTGTVPSEAARTRAVEIARTTKGVRQVDDHLKLRR